MTFIDWAIFFAFLAWVVWDGVRKGRDSSDLEGYFAGSRQIPWWAAGLSVMATQASAITVIGTTGQGHETGMEFVQTYFGLPFAMILICIFLVPVLRRNPILTAYEYLEGRFGPATRSLASVIFLVSRCLAFGVVIYAPAVVLSAMTGVNPTWTTIFIGLLTTTYTMLGGVKAVVSTDVKQMTVIIGGLLVCCGVLLFRLMSEMDFLDILRLTGASGKLNAVEPVPASWDLIPNWKYADTALRSFWEDSYNIWSGLFGGIFLMLAYFGCDQSQVQRILTNPTADESRKTLLLSAFAKVPMQVLVLFIGALLFLFNVLGHPPLLFNPDHRLAAQLEENAPRIESIEQEYEGALERRRELALALAATHQPPLESPDLLAQYQDSTRQVSHLRSQARTELGVGTDTNFIFPHFMLRELPPLLVGLLVAAVFAAAMSSADSALNSLTSSTIVDLYKRWLRPDIGEAQALRASRITTAFWGIAATAAALQFQGSGSVIELVNRVGSYFYGSLLGVFILALFCKRAGPYASFVGMLGGMATVLVVNQTLRFEFLWYNIIGCLGVLVVGWIVSRFEDGAPSPVGAE